MFCFEIAAFSITTHLTTKDSIEHGTTTINMLQNSTFSLCCIQAPTGLTFGTQPSLKLLSSFCISSALFAAAIAARTRAFSSSVIRRPALPGIRADAAFGSSDCTIGFDVDFVTVVEMVVASAVNNPSGVKNIDLAACRSYSARYSIRGNIIHE